MLLSARLLVDVGDVNNFDYTQTLQWTQGDRPVLTFQAVDRAVEPQLNPPGRRWIPPVLATQPVAASASLAGTPGSSGTMATSTLWYSVIAYVNGAWTLPSEVASVISVTGPTGSVALTWTVAGATNYKLYRGTTSGGEGTLVYTGAGASFTDTGVAGTAEYPSLGTFQAMSVTITDINSSVTTWAQATNPFSLDTSIFSVDLFSTLPPAQIDAFRGTYGLKLAWETGVKATVAAVTQGIGAITIDQPISATQPQAGFLWYGGYRYAYSSWTGKTFVLNLTTGPQLAIAPVAGTSVWIPTATIWGFVGQAANITLREPEF